MTTINATLLSMVILHNEETDEVLLLDRPPEAGFPGYIGPGGKIELTESFTEGAVRELYEETGFIVHPIDLIFKGIDEFIIPEENYRYIVFNYVAHSFSGSPHERPPEGKLHWVKRSAATELPMQNWFQERFPKFFEEGTFEVSIEYEKHSEIPVKLTRRTLG
ncbi:NUDIX domain-containing protein [Guptibacillus hwajinpoensis]|uniref:NUDIX domain-containing protein n=1 Tax=Guptibacillus hwajinpoensis TaxID=208199 RepID=UPI001CD39B9B|nr:8-oxo-dGTP diphosphatase [Pseudalkalibacillus hwajinpoensis]MCA0992324.1 8-oxo-dGTP diphosphatase [Pseudalkalibacillus hwajinpoensis]